MLQRNLRIAFSLLFLFLAQTSCAQDCMGATFSVTGYVVDPLGKPVSGATINARNTGSFEKPPFNVNAISDQNGFFATENVFSYGCTSFTVEVYAPNHQSKTLTFYPPASEGWPNELPKVIRIELNPTLN